jgi:hypothetical protein
MLGIFQRQCDEVLLSKVVVERFLFAAFFTLMAQHSDCVCLGISKPVFIFNYLHIFSVQYLAFMHPILEGFGIELFPVDCDRSHFFSELLPVTANYRSV